MKKQKQRNTTRTPDFSDAGPLYWTQLFRAFEEAFEWALDVAVQIARDFPEEVEAVERVRAFMRKRLAGNPSKVSKEDILFTFGLLIGAIERDLEPTARKLGPWFSPPIAVRLPSANELWERALPRLVIGSRPFHIPNPFTA